MALKSLKERKEDLIIQARKQKPSERNSYNEGMEKGIAVSFHSFSNLVEIYRKYQNNVKLLMDDEKQIWKKWVDYYERQTNISKLDYINCFNEWLFDYLFCNLVVNEEMFTSLY
jgi:hypothetical protein